MVPMLCNTPCPNTNPVRVIASRENAAPLVSPTARWIIPTNNAERRAHIQAGWEDTFDMFRERGLLGHFRHDRALLFLACLEKRFLGALDLRRFVVYSSGVPQRFECLGGRNDAHGGAAKVRRECSMLVCGLSRCCTHKYMLYTRFAKKRVCIWRGPRKYWDVHRSTLHRRQRTYWCPGPQRVLCLEHTLGPKNCRVS